MKNKKTIFMLLAFCLIMPAVLVLSACGHKHSFSKDWSTDAEYHWHVCIAKDCDQVDAKQKHDYTDDNDASCNTCDYKRVALQNQIEATIEAKTYNGKSQPLVQGTDFTATYGTATVVYKSRGSAEEYVATAPKDAGQYTAKIIVQGNAIYSGVTRIVDYTIDKYQINDLNGEKTFEYLPTVGKYTATVTSFNKIEGDNVKVLYKFDNMAVGQVTTNIMLDNTEDAKNYQLNLTDASGKVVARKISLGNGKKNNKFKIYNTVDGGFSLVKVDTDFFASVGSDEVYIKISSTNNWDNGTIQIVSSDADYAKGQNELATLTGKNANSYVLTGTATATFTKRKSTIVGKVRGYTAIAFGSEGDVVNYGATSFVINPSQNDYRKLIDQAKNKQFTADIYVDSTKIASLKGVGFDTKGDMRRKYFGGSFDEKTGIASFDLLKNISGYTDKQGRWICSYSSVNLEIALTLESVDVANMEGEAFGSGKLTNGSIYVFRADYASSDYIVKLNFGSLKLKITVYNSEDNANGEDEGVDMDYSAEDGANYSDSVYFYVEVLDGGSSTATLSFETIE